MVCSICHKKGHNRNNSKFHTKDDLESHNNSILSKKLVKKLKNILISQVKKQAYSNSGQ